MGPHAEQQPPYDLVVGDASENGVPGIQRHAAVVAHHKDFGLRHLIRQRDIAVAQGFLHQIGLI